jgi:hypothetical protein
MNRFIHFVLLGGISLASAITLQGAVITVNSSAANNSSDDQLTIIEAILYINGDLGRAISGSEKNQIEGTLGQNDRIAFDIPGEGPHLIPIPQSGLPQVKAENIEIDGYSQPNAKPNTNSILEPNNADIRIIIDGRTGGKNSSDDLFTIEGDQVVVKGISFLSSFAGESYGVNFREGATGGRVSGCWIGVHPDGETVSGGMIGLGACSTGGSQIFGTNGDGLDDRAEFNVIVGFDVNTILESASDCRISGNFIGVMPDGISLIPEDAQSQITEGDAIEGGGVDRLIIGTNGDGIGDEDERNIIGGMGNEVIEFFFGVNEEITIAGNYFGVGIDGATPLPNNKFLNVSGLNAQIGTNLDGVSDDLEANLFANFTGVIFDYTSVDQYMRIRGNIFNNNLGPLFDNLSNSYAAFLINDGSDFTPTLKEGSGIAEISGTLTLAGPGPDGLKNSVVDVYLAEINPLGEVPNVFQFLASFEEGSVDDLEPAQGEFKFSLEGVEFPVGTSANLVVTSIIEAVLGSDTSGFSNPVTVDLPLPGKTDPPHLSIDKMGNDVWIQWEAPGFILQGTTRIGGSSWSDISESPPYKITGDQLIKSEFFRLNQ